MSIIKPWVDSLPPSENVSGLQLAITLGDNCGSDEMRSTYWTAIRSIGSTLEGFPKKFKQKSRGPRPGTILREEFEKKLHQVSASISVSGRVAYERGVPSLKGLRVEASFVKNESGLGKAKKVREICSDYSLIDENVNIRMQKSHGKGGKGKNSRYYGGRTGAYNGRNRWPL